jgi:hypothetical protein
MTDGCDILLLGTGPFAQRIACDLAATATKPTRVTLAGRNAFRLAWILTAARARAEMFARPVGIEGRWVDLTQGGGIAQLLASVRPRVIVQAASLQPAAAISGGTTAWTRFVGEAGLSATAVFQAVLTSRVGSAAAKVCPTSSLVNCCFPDVTNGIVAAMGLPVACGIGNIAILAHAFASLSDADPKPKLQMLCHYQNLAPWRAPPAQRSGRAPRVWLDGVEVYDAYRRFAAVQLTPEPVIDISGASGVTLILAMAHRSDWSGHVPGPLGLPGGYPVSLQGGCIVLDLPAGVDREAAVQWNAAHEVENGLVVGGDGWARYKGAAARRSADRGPGPRRRLPCWRPRGSLGRDARATRPHAGSASMIEWALSLSQSGDHLDTMRSATAECSPSARSARTREDQHAATRIVRCGHASRGAARAWPLTAQGAARPDRVRAHHASVAAGRDGARSAR